MMAEARIDILTLSEAKEKSKGEKEVEGKKRYQSGEERANGGVAVLFKWD